MVLQVVATDSFVIVVCKALATGGSMRLYQRRTEVALLVQLLQDAANLQAAARALVCVSPAQLSEREEDLKRQASTPGAEKRSVRGQTHRSKTFICSFVWGGTGGAPPEPPQFDLQPVTHVHVSALSENSLHEVDVWQVESGHCAIMLLTPVHSPHLNPTDHLPAPTTNCPRAGWCHDPGLGRDLREAIRRFIGEGPKGWEASVDHDLSCLLCNHSRVPSLRSGMCEVSEVIKHYFEVQSWIHLYDTQHAVRIIEICVSFTEFNDTIPTAKQLKINLKESRRHRISLHTGEHCN